MPDEKATFPQYLVCYEGTTGDGTPGPSGEDTHECPHCVIQALMENISVMTVGCITFFAKVMRRESETDPWKEIWCVKSQSQAEPIMATLTRHYDQLNAEGKISTPVN